MAGVSERPYRVIAFRLGAALCPTELVSSQGLMRANQRTLKYLRFDPEVERPYSLQIFGGEPEAMALASVMGKEYGAQIIDINMGCPVKKVTKNGAGSALLCEPLRAGEIVRRIREATGLPVTCKIRSGWDEKSRNYLQLAGTLFEAGCAALAIHPRTREQGYSGKADWSVIADLKRHFPDRVIIGNGDVKTPADARRMLDSTGCDFVMIGRAALGNPWIFRELTGGEPPTPGGALRGGAGALPRACGLRGGHAGRGALASAGTWRWYAHGLHGAAAFRAEVNALETPEAVEDAVRRFFASAPLDASRLPRRSRTWTTGPRWAEPPRVSGRMSLRPWATARK